jgi:hypothetical protein
MNTDVTLISVVRDKAMYDNCITSNSCVNQYTLIAIDNTTENKGIPARYNNFLSVYDYAKPTWFVFCHEDFEFKEDIGALLSTSDPHYLYGPIGAITKVYLKLLYLWQPCGSIIESNKDGTNLHSIGAAVADRTPVETFDCACLIVHSDLVKTNNLRFDENLSFDLYIEDFCIVAHEKHRIRSLILNFDCRHWSGGKVTQRFYDQLSYLNKKHDETCYTSLCTYNIGHPNIRRKLNYFLRDMLKQTFLFLKKSLGAPLTLR